LPVPKFFVDREAERSGEYYLGYLAKESGGKYLEGVKEKITATLEQMHRAYYEISFPDPPQFYTKKNGRKKMQLFA
jgi:hypothetical protein